MRPLRGGLKRCVSVDSIFRRARSRCCPSYWRGIRHLAKMGTEASDDYPKWTKDSLIERLRHVEAELKRRPSPPPSPGHNPPASHPPAKKRKEQPKMDPANYHTRHIALKLAYLGRNYGGFEFTSSGTLPSIEEELFKALTKSCLIFPKDERLVDFSECEYSKCGRTDRGVSAFGQVIGLKVRSARPTSQMIKKKKQKEKQKERAAKAGGETTAGAAEEDMEMKSEETDQDEEPELPPFDPIKDELPYPKILNRILPRDIRILAWCPSPPPDFSARFSCREREYRYFFTQPAFNPPRLAEGQKHAGWLDVEAMRDAARRFEGERDFQNFCKIDPAKNISSYKRTIMESNIYEVDGMASNLPHLAPAATAEGLPQASYPKVYYFKVRGTAFLWHQIRHMVSILFHVGQGLESPDLVDQLLDTERNPRRPTYTMADEVPLVLWDCSFEGLDWVNVDDDVDPGKSATAFGATDGVWSMWREIKMDEILANGLLRVVAQGENNDKPAAPEAPARTKAKRGAYYSMKRFDGGSGARAVGKYVPVMEMHRMDTPTEQNNRYAQRKGFADHGEMLKHRATKFEEKKNKGAGGHE